MTILAERPGAHEIRLTEAEQFFYDNAGWSYDTTSEDSESGRIRGALALARAERFASAISAEVTWEEDAEPDAGWCGCGEDHGQAFAAVLRSDEGEVLGSLSGITLGTQDPGTDPYARVVAAQLADEYL